MQTFEPTYDEQNAADYEKGYNHASIIAEYEPDLLAAITPEVNEQDAYFQGFFDCKEALEIQRLKEHDSLNELEKIRSTANENEHLLDR